MKLGGQTIGARPSTSLLTAGQVESEILRLTDKLEEETEEFARRAERAAEAEADWKYNEAMVLLHSDGKSEYQRKAEAIEAHADKRREYRVAEARRDATAEACRTLRASLESLRTIAANVRSQT